MNIKKLIVSILIPLFVGGIAGIFTMNSMDDYKLLAKPILSPPGFLFPIVWTILFILMGIGCYLISNSNFKNKDTALKLYFVQLIINFFWTIIFFVLKLRLFAFIWILLLIVLVYFMIKEFYKINKLAAYLQIPYLLWLIFAAYLNFSIYLLNR